MEENIKIRRITDYAVPMEIVFNGQIYPDAFEDGFNPDLPDVINEFFLGVWIDDPGLIGFYKVQQMGMHLYLGHANIMRGFRRKYAQSATYAAMQWVAQNVEGFETLMAWVPQCFENVKAHVIGAGFNAIGTLPNAFKKNGAMIDIDIFAITKEQILSKKDG